MNKQTIIGYLKTILFSFLFALITTIGIVAYTLNTINVEEHIRAQQEEEKIDDETLDVMIAKSEYLKSLKPGSYSVSLKLALLYELKGDMKTAEEEYKSAINKAPYHEFKPKFEFSKFLINNKRYGEAEAVMNGIGEKPKTKLITYKGEIFESLGDKYFEQNRFDLAQQKYNKSKVYYGTLHKNKNTKTLNEKIASSLVYLAEDKVKQNKADEAIEHLYDAKKLINSPLIKYQLAILLIAKDPVKSCKYFDEVFKEAPHLINYKEYLALLTGLSEYEESRGNYVQADLYKFKIKKVKNYYIENIVKLADFDIDTAVGRIRTNRIFRTYKIDFIFRFKNKSLLEMKNVYLQFVFKDGDNVLYEVNKQVVTPDNILEPGASIDYIQLSSPRKHYKELPKEIKAEIYASKQFDAYKILLKEIYIVKSKKKHRTFIEKLFLKHIYPYLGL